MTREKSHKRTMKTGETASKLGIYMQGKKGIRGMKTQHEARGGHFGNRIGMAKKLSNRNQRNEPP